MSRGWLWFRMTCLGSDRTGRLAAATLDRDGTPIGGARRRASRCSLAAGDPEPDRGHDGGRSNSAPRIECRARSCRSSHLFSGRSEPLRPRHGGVGGWKRPHGGGPPERAGDASSIASRATVGACRLCSGPERTGADRSRPGRAECHRRPSAQKRPPVALAADREVVGSSPSEPPGTPKAGGLPARGQEKNSQKRGQENLRSVWLGALALPLAGAAPASLRVTSGGKTDEIDGETGFKTTAWAHGSLCPAPNREIATRQRRPGGEPAV